MGRHGPVLRCGAEAERRLSMRLAASGKVPAAVIALAAVLVGCGQNAAPDGAAAARSRAQVVPAARELYQTLFETSARSVDLLDWGYKPCGTGTATLSYSISMRLFAFAASQNTDFEAYRQRVVSIVRAGGWTLRQRPSSRSVTLPTVAPVSPFTPVIDKVMPEVAGWLQARGVDRFGPAIFRYNVIDMPRLDVEMGFAPLAPLKGEGRVQGGTVPAGHEVLDGESVAFAFTRGTGGPRNDDLGLGRSRHLDHGRQLGWCWHCIGHGRPRRSRVTR